MFKQAIVLTCFICVGGSLHSQSTSSRLDFTHINQLDWIIPKNDTLAFAFGDYQGKPALLLKRNFLNSKSASIAYPKDLQFKDGVIELDIASPAGAAGYIGLAFRIMDEQHYETVYFRPGGSGSLEALQYMPEKKAEFNWWDYEDAKYQAKDSLPLTGWFHIKVVVKGKTLNVYTHHQPTPVYSYNALDPNIPKGSVGFWLGNSLIGAYKNLVVKKD